MTRCQSDKLIGKAQHSHVRAMLIEMLWTFYMRQALDNGRPPEEAFELADQQLAQQGLL